MVVEGFAFRFDATCDGERFDARGFATAPALWSGVPVLIGHDHDLAVGSAILFRSPYGVRVRAALDDTELGRRIFAAACSGGWAWSIGAKLHSHRDRWGVRVVTGMDPVEVSFTRNPWHRGTAVLPRLPSTRRFA